MARAGPVPTGAPDSETNMHGSFVDLAFDQYVPDLSADQVKNLLRPVFDFEAKSALEAYLETVPPKVKDAIKEHHVLVGMDRDMVIYAKGRAPKKDREKDGDTEYEEWIYGEPPQEVDFVRFVGDEVVRVETMTVTGEKVIRSEKEVELAAKPDAKAAQTERPANAPTLRRPGEAPDPHDPGSSNGNSTGKHRCRRSRPPLMMAKEGSRRRLILAAGLRRSLSGLRPLGAPNILPLHWKHEDRVGTNQSHGGRFCGQCRQDRGLCR